MYYSYAYDEVISQLDRLKQYADSLKADCQPFKNGFEPATPGSAMEDYNASLAFGAFWSKRAVKKAQNRTPKELIKAIRKNDMELFYNAFYFGKPDVRYRDETHRSFLDYAIMYNNPVAVKILLNADADPKYYHPEAGLAIFNALQPDKTFHGKHLCAFFIMRDSDLYIQNQYGENSIMKILKQNLVDLFDELYFSDLQDCPLTNDGETMLHYAAKHSNNQIINSMLNMKFNVKDKTTSQQTLLHILACRSDKKELIQKVIDKGVDVDAVDVLGNTALHYATQYGQAENVEVLLNRGANPLIKNINQKIPMSFVEQCQSSNHQAIAKVSTLLSKAMSQAFENMPNFPTQNGFGSGGMPGTNRYITSQKPPINPSDKSNQHSPE